MQLKWFKTLDAGKRVQVFLAGLTQALVDLVGPVLRGRLDDAVAQLEAYRTEQDLTVKSVVGETTAQEAMRQDLYRRYMRPIGKIARTALAGSPKELSLLIVPAFSVNNGRVGDFISDADNVLAAAQRNEQLLLAHGLPANLVAQFKDALSQLDASTSSRHRTFQRRVASTAGLGEMNRAIKLAIDNIDSVLSSALKATPAVLAQWNVAKKIVKTPVTPNPTGNDAAETSAPATPAVTPAAPAAPALTIADGNKAAA
jgi:hypothetical protein